MKQHIRRRFFTALCAVLLVAGALCMIAVAESGTDLSDYYKQKDIDASWSETNATAVNLSELKEPLVISAPGDYVLSGETVYPIVIEASKSDDIRLILNGAAISSASGPAILEKTADKLILTLAEGTENTLSDQTSVPVGDDLAAAAIYAQDDLSINGSGSLSVSGTVGHGIQTKADLIIGGGNLQVTSVKDAIRGRNSVLILDGGLSLSALGDGISATRDNREDKGWILIAGGTVQAVTGGGAGDGIASSADSGSRKGIKAATDLSILGGALSLDCEDDGLRAENISISGGDIIIRSGDDGLRARGTLFISDGSLKIPQCKEGLEGSVIIITGGTLSITCMPSP